MLLSNVSRILQNIDQLVIGHVGENNLVLVFHLLIDATKNAVVVAGT